MVKKPASKSFTISRNIASLFYTVTLFSHEGKKKSSVGSVTRYSYTLILQKFQKTVGNRWKNKMPWTLNLSSVCLNKVSFKVTLHSVLTFKKDQHARTDSRDCILLALWCFHFVTYYFLYRADTGFLLGPTPLQPHQISQNSLWQNTFLTLASKAPLEATAPFENQEVMVSSQRLSALKRSSPGLWKQTAS